MLIILKNTTKCLDGEVIVMIKLHMTPAIEQWGITIETAELKPEMSSKLK